MPVENEIGMIPSARDHSDEANRLFGAAVPVELMKHVVDRSDTLAPELRATWVAAGGKRSGTWAQVFGTGAAADEIFMAWHFARYGVNGAWKNIRWLNGDQTHQGRHLRLEPGRFSTQRITLYRYR